MIYAAIFLIIVFILNLLIRYSYWYRIKYEDSLKFKNVPKDIEVINLGSNSGKYGFDYSDFGILGMNWAVGPQTITFDRKILQNYISHLKKEAFVILTIVPFSSILKNYKARNANDKYYLFLPSSLIPNYSIIKHLKILLEKGFPVLSILRHPRLVLQLYKKPLNVLKYNPLINEDMLKKDALKWIDGWKKQFGINDLEAPLSQEHEEIMKYNRKVFTDMIYMCRKNGIKPVVVLPPVTKYLLYYLNSKTRDVYVYNFLSEIIDQTKVKLLDYMGNEEFSDQNLYFNSFFLNLRGRKKFTNKVIDDINAIEVL